MTCLKPLQVVGNIQRHVNAGYDGLQAVFVEAARNVKWFMENNLRFQMKHRVFQESDKEIHDAEAETFEIITMD